MAIAVRGYYEVSDWYATGTSNNVTGVAWESGDVVVVAQWNSDGDASSAIVAPTNANLTFTSRQDTTAASAEAQVRISTAVAGSSQTGQTITSGRSGATNTNGAAVWVLSGADGYRGGWQNRDESATSYTPLEGSAIICLLADWNASASERTGTTASGTLTEREDSSDPTWGGVHVYDWVGVNAGSQSFGVTSYTGMKAAQAGVEITAAAGGMAVTITNKFAGDVNSATSLSNKTAATADCGTVATGAILLVSQFGTSGANGNVWSTPTKSSGTATIGTPVQISQTRPGLAIAESVVAVWRIPVTAGGTLVLTTDDAADTYGYAVIVDELTGHDPTTPIAGLVTRTWEWSSGGLDQSAANSTLAATPVSDDVTYCVGNWDVDAGTNSAAAGTGFTERNEVASQYTLGITQTRTGSTSTTVAWPTETSSGQSYSFTGIAFIIKKAPRTVATDDFNRANGGLGGNWTTPTSFTAPQIVSNAAAATANEVSYGSLWTADTFADDQWVEFDATVPSGNYSHALIILACETDASDAIYAKWDNLSGGSYEVREIIGGSDSLLGSSSTGVGNGTRKLRLERVGTLVKLYVDGVEQISRTVSGSHTGYPGFGLYEDTNNALIDNFSAGDWSQGGEPPAEERLSLDLRVFLSRGAKINSNYY